MNNELRIKEGHHNQCIVTDKVEFNYVKGMRKDELVISLTDGTKEITLELTDDTIKQLKELLGGN